MVNIDTVYQRVLAIANKEQRGHITPLEFNLLANQAQLVVFEQYFYDRHQTARVPGSKINHSDVDAMLDEKISIFEIRNQVLTGGILPINLYRLDSLTYNANECTEVSAKEWAYIQHSSLLQPTTLRPIYIRGAGGVAVHGDGNLQIGIFPDPINVLCNFIQQPERVEWGYDVIGEKALFNGAPGRTTHFQHHPSEETELVMRILELAGVIIEDPNVTQYANQKIKEQVQQEKS